MLASSYQSWRGSGHLERAVDSAGGPEVCEAGDTRLRDQAQAWRQAPGGAR